jgi:hypothetical protein
MLQASSSLEALHSSRSRLQEGTNLLELGFLSDALKITARRRALLPGDCYPRCSNSLNRSAPASKPVAGRTTRRDHTVLSDRQADISEPIVRQDQVQHASQHTRLQSRCRAFLPDPPDCRNEIYGINLLVLPVDERTGSRTSLNQILVSRNLLIYGNARIYSERYFCENSTPLTRSIENWTKMNDRTLRV